MDLRADGPSDNKERPVTLHGLSIGRPIVAVNGFEVSVSLAPLESAFIQLK